MLVAILVRPLLLKSSFCLSSFGCARFAYPFSWVTRAIPMFLFQLLQCCQSIAFSLVLFHPVLSPLPSSSILFSDHHPSLSHLSFFFSSASLFMSLSIRVAIRRVTHPRSLLHAFSLFPAEIVCIRIFFRKE